MINIPMLAKKTKIFLEEVFYFIKNETVYLFKNHKNLLAYIKANIKNGATRNFILGKEMLARGLILDAKFRFLLASRFSKNSTISLYYLAYVYMKESNMKKSAKILQQIAAGKKYRKKILFLINEIERDQKIFN